MNEYAIRVNSKKSFDKTKEIVSQKLLDQGFGILTEIKVHEKFKEKLGIDYPRYEILGACNPPIAHKALEVDENLGVLLPCNVVLKETNKGTLIIFQNPKETFSIVNQPQLSDFAEEVSDRILKVIQSLENELI
ncbi:MAG: DUF302 domain-containing protein [Calditrichia bacterium]